MLLAVPFVLTALVLPFAVWLVDQTGCRPAVCGLASALAAGAFAGLRFLGPTDG